MRARLMGAYATALLLAACAVLPPELQRAPNSGTVGVKLEMPGDEGTHKLGPGESAQPPAFFKRNQPLPVYPTELLGLPLPTVVVPTLLSVDDKGALYDVSFPSPGQASTDCDAHCVALFRSAIRERVGAWTFGPFEVFGFIDGPDEDGDGEADSVLRGVIATRPYSLRMRFEFEQSNGSGLVRRDVFD